MTLPLTEDEKDSLVEEHKGIVYHMANKYRYLDNDIEEVRAWCYLGMAMAIDEYDKDREHSFAPIAFTQIKLVIYGHFFNKNRKQIEDNLDAPAFTGQDGDVLTLGDMIPDDNYHYSEKDIVHMIDDALSEQPTLHKELTIDYFINDKDFLYLVKASGMNTLNIKRTINKCKRLIKTYLVNNGIISAYLLYPIKEYEFKNHVYEKVTKEESAKIKYVRKHYEQLNINDIANLMNLDPYVVLQVVSYPTREYIRCVPDETIRHKADQYCIENYPEQVPSEVKVYEMV